MPFSSQLSLLFYLCLGFVTFYSASAQTSFHNLSAVDAFGDTIDMSDYAGKKILVVNTASKCGFTPQYDDLQSLYEKYRQQDFLVIAFPSDNFLNQEFDSNAEVVEFCQTNYNISFPIMSKINVKGSDKHPIYQWLTDQSLNGYDNSRVKWNFQKYMINESGELAGYLAPSDSPFDEKIIQWIEE